MSFAVIHMLVPGILVDIFERWRTKHHAPGLLLLAAAFGGILPDADFILEILGPSVGLTSILFRHGGITHTLIFAAFIAVIGLVLLAANKKWAPYAFAVSFGVLMHLALDALIGGGRFGGLLLLYPFSNHLFALPVHVPPNLLLMAALDGIFLGLWLTYMVFTRKLKEFS